MNTHITIIVSTILSVLSTFTAITSGEPSPSQPLPKFLTGTWIVKTAKINKTVGELYMGPWPNDPRYVGRTFDFGTDKVTSTAPEVHADCLAPTIRSERMTVADAFRHGMEDDVTPGDFDVPINADSVVSIYQIECNTQLWYRGLMRADSKKPKVIDGPWIIELPNSQIGMPWLDSVFLTVERLPANSIPTASFDCKKATKPSETVICKSVELARFDLSVANAFTRVLGLNDPGKSTRLKATQKYWLKELDKCGTDPMCLRKSMTDRLEAIWEIRNNMDIEEPRPPLCEPNCE